MDKKIEKLTELLGSAIENLYECKSENADYYNDELQKLAAADTKFSLWPCNVCQKTDKSGCDTDKQHFPCFVESAPDTRALAGYLSDYVEQEENKHATLFGAGTADKDNLKSWLLSGIEAFESTENVKIRIESEA